VAQHNGVFVRFIAGAAIAWAVLLAAGCGSANNGKSALDGSPEVNALYKDNCMSCHASGLNGRMGEKTDLRKVGSRMSEAEIYAQIENGKGLMPAFKDRLAPEDIERLAQWLAAKK
jgi:cytochrome c551